jgi:putative NADPH-quinone reductase
MTKICIIQGHPDNGKEHFCHALAKTYKDGALAHRHEVHTIDIASLKFDLLRDPNEDQNGRPFGHYLSTLAGNNARNRQSLL